MAISREEDRILAGEYKKGGKGQRAEDAVRAQAGKDDDFTSPFRKVVVCPIVDLKVQYVYIYIYILMCKMCIYIVLLYYIACCIHDTTIFDIVLLGISTKMSSIFVEIPSETSM